MNNKIRQKLSLIEDTISDNLLAQINTILDSQQFDSYYTFSRALREEYRNRNYCYKLIISIIDFISFESDDDLKNKINLAMYKYDFSTDLKAHLLDTLNNETFDDLEKFTELVLDNYVYQDEFIYYSHANDYLDDLDETIFELIREYRDEFGDIPKDECQLATWHDQREMTTEIYEFIKTV